jgi:hypothetical protein
LPTRRACRTPQAPSRGKTGEDSSAAPSAGELPGIIVNEIPEQRSPRPATDVVPPISALQATPSMIGPTWLNNSARSAGPGSGLGGGGDPDSSGAIWT